MCSIDLTWKKLVMIGVWQGEDLCCVESRVQEHERGKWVPFQLFFPLIPSSFLKVLMDQEPNLLRVFLFIAALLFGLLFRCWRRTTAPVEEIRWETNKELSSREVVGELFKPFTPQVLSSKESSKDSEFSTLLNQREYTSVNLQSWDEAIGAKLRPFQRVPSLIMRES